MPSLFVILFLLCSLPALRSQVTSAPPYQTIVYGQGELEMARGHLIALKDTSVVLLAPTMNSTGSEAFQREIDIRDISVIKSRKKNHALTGFAIGSLSGFLLVYAATNDLNRDNPKLQLGLSTYGAGLGAAMGLLLSSIRVSFPLSGDHDTYQRKRSKLKNYLRPY